MKKILLIITILLTCNISFSQMKRYHYLIKIENLDPNEKDTRTWLNGMFNVNVSLNDSTGYFDFYSNFEISESLFLQKAQDRNLLVSDFDRYEIIVAKPEDYEEFKN